MSNLDQNPGENMMMKNLFTTLFGSLLTVNAYAGNYGETIVDATTGIEVATATLERIGREKETLSPTYMQFSCTQGLIAIDLYVDGEKYVEDESDKYLYVTAYSGKDTGRQEVGFIHEADEDIFHGLNELLDVLSISTSAYVSIYRTGSFGANESLRFLDLRGSSKAIDHIDLCLENHPARITSLSPVSRSELESIHNKSTNELRLAEKMLREGKLGKIVEPTKTKEQEAAEKYSDIADSKYMSVAQTAVTSSLKDPDSAKFSKTFVVAQDDYRIVCGFVNARNIYGGYTGNKRFMWEPTGVIKIEGRDPNHNLDISFYCY